MKDNNPGRSPTHVARAVLLILISFCFCPLGLAAESTSTDAALEAAETIRNSAQEAAESSADQKIAQLLETRAMLITQVEERAAKHRELEAQLSEGGGDEQLVVLAQLGRVEARILEILDDLVQNVQESEKAGLDTTEMIELLARLFDNTSDYLSAFITRLQNFVLTLNASREEVPLEDLLSFEQRLSDHNGDIENYYQILLDHADRMAAVGLDPSGPLEFIKENLPVRAERILGRAELAAEQRKEISRRISAGANDARSQAELEIAQTRFNWTTRNLADIVRMLDRLRIPTAEYRQFLISATGTLTEDIFDTEVLGGLLDDSLASTRNWLQENGLTAVFRVALFILILVVFSWLGKLVGGLVGRGLQASRLHMSAVLESMVSTIVARIVLAIGIVFGLSQLGVEIGPLLAGIGIVGFAVGFALQETLSNFASGTMLLAYRPFDAGDVIEAGGFTATVERLSLVNTTMLTFDNRRVTVPNNKIWGDVIVNVTAMETRRVDITIGLAHHERVERVEAILHEIVYAHPNTLDDPEPVVQVHGIDESAVRMIVRPWVRTEDYWPTYWDLNRQIKLRFEQENIQFGAQRISLESQNQSDN